MRLAQFDLRPLERGMTLVEVMVVVFIIGLTSSLVILTMPQRTDPAELVADNFARDVRQLADRAILTGRMQGIDLNDEGYLFVQWDGVEWARLQDRGIDRAEQVQMRVIGSPEDATVKQPNLVFDPTGVNDPVQVEISVGANQFLLLVDANGEVVRETR